MRTIKIISKLIITSVLLILVSCENNDPISSAPSESKVTILKTNQASMSKLYSVNKWIDQNGGTISIGDEDFGYSFLDFPANALSDSLNISFSWETSGLLQATFAPHGTQFDQPVNISLSYKNADLAGVNPQDLRIYYYHEEIDTYELVESQVNLQNETVDGVIHHFSRYAVGYE